MAFCIGCRKQTYIVDPATGLCGDCQTDTKSLEGAEAFAQQSRLDAAEAERVARIVLTTETAHNLPVVERLGIVTAEVVFGMHLFKDLAAVVRDVFGGRSKVLQNGLREARSTALHELRLEAQALGADAVVGVDLAYSQISGDGRNMLLLVASGTAVTLAKATH